MVKYFSQIAKIVICEVFCEKIIAHEHYKFVNHGKYQCLRRCNNTCQKLVLAGDTTLRIVVLVYF